MKESSSIPIFWGFYFEKPAAILQGALQLLLTSRLSERSKREEKKVFLGAHQDRVLTIVENMTETKVEVESPADPRTFCNPPQDNRQKLDPMGTRRELEESLLLLADVALAPPCGRDASCSCLEVRQAGLGLQCSQQQLQGFLKKVEHLRDCLVSRNSHLEKQALAAAVTTLLYTCQPFFRRLESTARSPTSKPSHLSAETGLLSDGAGVRFLTSALCASAAAGLLSAALRASGAAAADLRQIRDSVRGRGRAQQVPRQALHAALEPEGPPYEEVLSILSRSCDRSPAPHPHSVSHFCIGRCRLGRLKMTIFRYCKPTPYLSRGDTGLYKRMRWNVERLPADADGDEEEGESDRHTDYFFLCCEDLPNQSDQGALRVWSIGQWVQLDPDPQTDDLYDWILCDVPGGDFQKLLCLGCTEPSSCSATDVLLQLLLQQRRSE
ncbi:UPF0575 protein C19orf67 homolog isoform X2 [Oryzias latipes]